MLQLAIAMLLLALVAGLLGFTTIAGGLATIAKVAFFIFLVLFIVSAVAHAFRGRTPV